MNSLPQAYGPFKTSIRTRSSLIIIEELLVLLLCEELDLENFQDSVSDYSTSALLTAKESESRCFGFDNSRGFGNNCGSLEVEVAIMVVVIISEDVECFQLSHLLPLGLAVKYATELGTQHLTAITVCIILSKGDNLLPDL